MEFNNDREVTMRYAHRFGEIAVRMGFVNREHVKKALEDQIASHSFARLRPRKLIGEILFDNGWLTLKQIEKVTEEIIKESSKKKE